MDALTHAVEAYIGGSTTKETRAMAEEAVSLIHEHLKNAYDNGHNKEARKGMLRAAYCAVLHLQNPMWVIFMRWHILWADSTGLPMVLPMR